MKGIFYLGLGYQVVQLCILCIVALNFTVGWTWFDVTYLPWLVGGLVLLMTNIFSIILMMKGLGGQTQ